LPDEQALQNISNQKAQQFFEQQMQAFHTGKPVDDVSDAAAATSISAATPSAAPDARSGHVQSGSVSDKTPAPTSKKGQLKLSSGQLNTANSSSDSNAASADGTPTSAL